MFDFSYGNHVGFRELLAVTGELSKLYTSTRLCTPAGRPCFNVEPDLQDLMATSRDPYELLWAWQGWRDIVGPCARMLYPALVLIQNQGAKNNGESSKISLEVWLFSMWECERVSN